MNDRATLRVPLSEPDLRILPLERARADWDALVTSHPEALYHRGPWLEVLRRAFGGAAAGGHHGMLGFNRGRLSACQGRKSAPAQSHLVAVFGFCPPLTRTDSLRESLMARMADAMPPQSSLEIRGVAGFCTRGTWYVTSNAQFVLAPDEWSQCTRCRRCFEPPAHSAWLDYSR
jgi:hypothetical protein